VKRVFLASVAFAAVTASAYAQEAPAAPTPAPAAQDDDNSEEIVVLAQPGDQVRIDRRTYTLRDDAAAQTTNMYDVLGQIPSVSVAPSGAVTLLGASDVTIQIDGRPVPGNNLEQVLRGLNGSDVERIEVITNPSAQYSAQASGGIINIITRHRVDTGFNGSIQTSRDTLGFYQLGISPTWSNGPWSLSGQLGLYGGQRSNALDRTHEDLTSGIVTTETGSRHFDFRGAYVGQLRAGYQPDPHRRMALSYDGSRNTQEQRQLSTIADSGGPLFDNASLNDSDTRFDQISFDFDQDGETPRETTKFTANVFRFLTDSTSDYSLSPTGGGTNAYATDLSQDSLGVGVKLDAEHPMGEQFFTYGGAFDYSEQTNDSALAPVSGAAPPAYDTRLQGLDRTYAAYATYQFNTGDWTWLPGLRGERYEREIQASGGSSDDSDTRFFPSLHVRRQLGSDLTMDVSYSSRIERPDFDALDPTLRFADVNRANSGNPDLRPTTTDAFEANLTYQAGGLNAGVTFFDRISDDIVSQFTEIAPGGVLLTHPVNAGSSEQRGLQVILRGPIGRHWRYSLSANALSRAFDVLQDGATERQDAFEYDGTAQLTYRDIDQNAIGADQLQLDLRFQGPRHGLQSVQDEFVNANLTWRRRLSQRVFGVLMIQDLLESANNISRVATDDYVERTEYRGAGRRLRLALTYQFGSGPQRPPPDQQGPPGPGGPS